jgi:hypothetical protein
MSPVPRSGHPGQPRHPHSGKPASDHAPPQVDDRVADLLLAELRNMLAQAGAPDDVLALLDGPGSPGEIMQRLLDAGAVPSPSESFDELVAGWEPLREPDTDPLDVELAGAEFLALLRAGADDPGDVPDMLATLVQQAEEHGGEAALAMLRALATMGPEQVRAGAGAAADRMAAAGAPDPEWVGQLGRPKVSTCFGYTDHVAQHAVAITFRYGRQRHALAVLIDHDLGGGVKDVWVTDRPNTVRTAYRGNAEWIGAQLEQYDPATAHAILAAALRQQPCPEQPDQVEDVDRYLDLLRSRVAQLADGTASVGSTTRTGPAAPAKPAPGEPPDAPVRLR